MEAGHARRMSNPAFEPGDELTTGRRLQTIARAPDEAVAAAPQHPIVPHPERMDSAQDLSAQYTAEALRRMRVEQRDLVNGALARLVQGAYGSCEDCGQTIDPERLRMLPEATRCVACQRQRDAVQSN